MTQYFNKAKEREKQRRLRNDMPAAEAVVWSRLRRKQVCGCKFRSQYNVGSYVLDFYCPALKLTVEINGDSHFVADANDYDQQRQAFIESFGIRFLRFTNKQVYENLEGVLQTIYWVAQGGRGETITEAKSPP